MCRLDCLADRVPAYIAASRPGIRGQQSPRYAAGGIRILDAKHLWLREDEPWRFDRVRFSMRVVGGVVCPYKAGIVETSTKANDMVSNELANLANDRACVRLLFRRVGICPGAKP